MNLNFQIKGISVRYLLACLLFVEKGSRWSWNIVCFNTLLWICTVRYFHYQRWAVAWILERKELFQQILSWLFSVISFRSDLSIKAKNQHKFNFFPDFNRDSRMWVKICKRYRSGWSFFHSLSFIRRYIFLNIILISFLRHHALSSNFNKYQWCFRLFE